MRSTTFTRSITSVSIKSVCNRSTIVMAGLGSAVRGVLCLTFMRERTGYQPRIVEPNSKHQSLHESSWRFDQRLDRLFKLLGANLIAVRAVQLVPAAARSARMDLIGKKRLRHLTVR